MSIVTGSCYLRVSLLGGGTDLPENVEIAGRTGRCLIAPLRSEVSAIADFTYVDGTDTRPFLTVGDSRCDTPLTHAVYDHPEIVSVIEEYRRRNPRVRMRLFMGEDVPTRGTGLGSSAAWVRANLTMLSNLTDVPLNRFDAHVGYDVERSIGSSCGYQDHVAAYVASTRGLGVFSVEFTPSDETRWYYDVRHLDVDFSGKMCLVRVPGDRDSNSILARQAAEMREADMNEMAQLVEAAVGVINADDDDRDWGHMMTEVGRMINESWRIKKSYTRGVTNDIVENTINACLASGAHGAKLAGAGACGFVVALVDDTSEFADLMEERGYSCFKVDDVLEEDRLPR